MPSSSEKQRKFMGAQLAAKRAGKPTKTKMSETQLSDFAGSVGSLEDIDFHENAAKTEIFDGSPLDGSSYKHAVHKGYKGCEGDNPGFDTKGAVCWGDLYFDYDGDVNRAPEQV